MSLNFEIIVDIQAIETIESSIRELDRLRKVHGSGRWRKLKGIGTIRFSDGKTAKAEIHWYEAHGIESLRVISL